jgi:hypothetical protein
MQGGIQLDVLPWAAPFGPSFVSIVNKCQLQEKDATLSQLQELAFAFSPRLETLKIALENQKITLTMDEFSLVVACMYAAVVTDEQWARPEVIGNGARGLLIRLVTTFIPLDEKSVEQLYELKPRYLMAVLREAYIKGPDHRYPKRYAELLAADIDRYHGYQVLMAESDKYAFQAQVEDNYVRMAEEEISMYQEAKNSFFQAISSFKTRDDDKDGDGH